MASTPLLIASAAAASAISACTNVSPTEGARGCLSESRSLYLPANCLRSWPPIFPAAPVIKIVFILVSVAPMQRLIDRNRTLIQRKSLPPNRGNKKPTHLKLMHEGVGGLL